MSRRMWGFAAAVAGIIAAAGALRMIGIHDNPHGVFCDEASIVNEAWALWRTGADTAHRAWPLLVQSVGDWKLPVFVYATVPAVAVLGPTVDAVRLTSALLGVLTVLAVGWLAWEVTRGCAEAALVAAAALAIEPWHVHYSRTGLGESVAMVLCLTVAAAAVMRATNRRRDQRPATGWDVTATLACVAACYSYRAAWLLVPALLVVLWGVAAGARVRVSTGGVWAALATMPLWIRLVQHTDDRAFQMDPLPSLAEAWARYQQYFGPTALLWEGDHGDVLRHFVPHQGWLLGYQVTWIGVAVIACTLVLILEPRVRWIWVLLGAVLLYPLPGVLTAGGVISSRVLAGSVLAALLTGLGVSAFWAIAKQTRGGRWGATVAAVAFGVSALAGTGLYAIRLADYPQTSSGYWGWQWGPEVILPEFAALAAVNPAIDDFYLDGDFNAPGPFLTLYAPGCDRCKIGGPLVELNLARRQWFALRPENVEKLRAQPGVARVVSYQTLTYPDGTTALQIVEPVAAEEGDDGTGD